MGAVFAIFSGFYYWFGKITGYLYSETLGKIHFWITFIGVNVTFFPMHMLGLSGMPRRIPDYPDMYAQLNFLCSIGSLISFFGVLLWFFIIFYAYYTKIKCPRNPWQFYSSYPLLIDRFFRIALYLSNVHNNKNAFNKKNNHFLSYTFDKNNKISLTYSPKNYKVDSLEWVLNSPPELHTFVVSPKVFTTSKKYFFYKYKRAFLKNNDFTLPLLYSNNMSYSNSNSTIHSHFYFCLVKNELKFSVLLNSKFEDTNITVNYHFNELTKFYISTKY